MIPSRKSNGIVPTSQKMLDVQRNMYDEYGPLMDHSGLVYNYNNN